MRIQYRFMKKRIIVLGHDPTLGRRLARILSKSCLSDVGKSACRYCEGAGVISKDQFSEVPCIKCGGTGQTEL